MGTFPQHHNRFVRPTRRPSAREGRAGQGPAYGPTRGPQGAFTPRALPISQWYHAGLSTYVDGTWQDLSGQGRHTSQATAGDRPALVYDDRGFLCLQFVASEEDHLNVTPYQFDTMTWAVILRDNDTPDLDGLWSIGSGTGQENDTGFSLNMGTTATQRWAVVAKDNPAGNAISVFADIIVVSASVNARGFLFGAVDLASGFMRGSGPPPGATLSTDTGDSAAMDTDGIHVIGARVFSTFPSAGSYFNGDIYEMLLVPTALTDFGLTPLHCYLTWRLNGIGGR